MKKYLKVASLLLALILMASCFAACGMKSAVEDSSYYYSSDDSTKVISKSSALDYNGYEPSSEAPTADVEKDTGTDDTVETSFEEKIIYTASYTLESTTFDKSYNALLDLIKTYKGFLQSTSVNGNNYYDSYGTLKVNNRRATIVARIPSNEFEIFLTSTGNIGNVVSKLQDAENITSKFTDIEARVESLKVQETRLLELMAKAADIKDLITLEDKLADVRYEIESYQRTLNNYQSQVDYSTVTLYLREVEVYTPTDEDDKGFFDLVWEALTEGIGDFLEGIGSIAIAIIYLLPTLILLALIAVIIIVIVRKKKAKKAKKEAEKQEETK